MRAADAGALRRAPAPSRTQRQAFGIAACGALLLASALSGLCIGAVALPLRAVIGALLGSPDAAGGGVSASLIVLEIRLPRVLLGALVGAGTAAAGALLQGLFRNPLADPGLIGISPGAALAAVGWIVLGGALPPVLPPQAQPLALPVAAFAGGLATTFVLQRIARHRGAMSVPTLLLAGIALGAFAGAVTGLLIFLADDGQLRAFTFWSLGSLGGATWIKVLSAAPFIAAILVAGPLLARGLDALTLGEEVAFHVGVDVERLKRRAVLAAAAAVGAAVAVAGVVGFVGLVVPHLLRLSMGPAHRFLLPGSALLGAALVIAADTLARTIVAPAELPLGVVTACVGAPFFLWLLLRGRAGILV